MSKNWTTSSSFAKESDRLSIGERKLVSNMLGKLDQFLQSIRPYNLLIRRMVLHLWIGRTLVVSCRIKYDNIHVYEIRRQKPDS